MFRTTTLMEGSAARATLLSFAKRQPLGALGALLTLAIVASAIAAPFVAPFDPIEPHYGDVFKAPGFPFILGTDNFGRDVLSRLIWGARTSMTVSFVGVLVGVTIGGVLGLASGYAGGAVDAVSQRLIDALLAFPVLILTMTVVAAFGATDLSLISAVALALVPQGARPVRAVAMAMRERQFVEAARAIGARPLRVVVSHVLPNCLTPYIVILSVSLGWAIVVEASLSFLGLGPAPPTPSWGAMLSSEGRQYLQRAPWLALAPGLTISLAVFSFSLFGEAISDLLDPRLFQKPSRETKLYV